MDIQQDSLNHISESINQSTLDLQIGKAILESIRIETENKQADYLLCGAIEYLHKVDERLTGLEKYILKLAC